MSEVKVIKVFTPIKRVPTMIGKAQNGQKLPFGPYTLPQVIGGSVMLLLAGVAAMSLPVNPALTFGVGLVITIIVVFGLRLLPETEVRLVSRALWIGRLIFVRKPALASGMPVAADSARNVVFIDESVVVLLPDPVIVAEPPPVQHVLEASVRGANKPQAVAVPWKGGG